MSNPKRRNGKKRNHLRPSSMKKGRTIIKVKRKKLRKIAKESRCRNRDAK